MLNKISNFTYDTELFLIIGHYNILLTDTAKRLWMITTPFGKYEYNRLLTGVWIVPNIFQYQMSALIDELDFVRAYLNNLLVITSG